VAGNRLTNGFDRAISLDVRHPDGRKYYARDVAVVGNVGRDNSNGSIIGASQGAPQRPGAGNYAIVGNVAAGSHRRTVYLGIEEAVRNVAIVGNVGRQGDFREQRSGIYVAGNVSNLTVAGNTLADYSLHGIELEGTGSGYAVVGNTVLSPAANGLHLATDWGTVTGNVVESPGGVGIEAAVGDAVVANNAVRHAGTTGVRVGAAGSAVVSGNHVSRSGRVDPAGAAEIRVDGSDCAVVGNVVRRRAPFGIRESPGAGRNSYLGNVVRTATGPAAVDGQAWDVRGADSRLAGNVPALDRPERREATGGTLGVAFDRPYEAPPVLDVQTESPATWGVDWRRNAAGEVVGADLAFTGPGGDPVSPVVGVGVRPGW
jgi:hypothetical protein